MGIELDWTSPSDKRSAASAEAAVKHWSHTMKSVMLNTNLPPIFVEECGNQARDIRNLVPLVRDINSRDNDAVLPLEAITVSRVSRRECYRRLHHLVPVGTPCLIENKRVINSNIAKTRAKWVVAMRMEKDLPIFMCPWTRATYRSKDYLEFHLPVGTNFFSFFKLEQPKASKMGRKIAERHDGATVTIKIDDLARKLPNPRQDDEPRTVRWRGIEQPEIYIQDKKGGAVHQLTTDGQMIAKQDGVKTVVTVPDRPPVHELVLTDDEVAVIHLTRDPYSVVGTRFVKAFYDGGEHSGDYAGIVTGTHTIAARTVWKVLYDADDGREELDYEEVVHHVIGRWITPPSLPRRKWRKLELELDHATATGTAPVRSTSENSLPPAPADISPALPGNIDNSLALPRRDFSCQRGSTSNKSTCSQNLKSSRARHRPTRSASTVAASASLRARSPYAALEHDDDVDTSVRRDVAWPRDHVSANGGMLAVADGETLPRWQDRAKIKTCHRQLAYRWWGVAFGADAPQPAPGYLGATFRDPWEGGKRGRKPRLPAGIELPLPSGDSWDQWLRVHERGVNQDVRRAHHHIRIATEETTSRVYRTQCRMTDARHGGVVVYAGTRDRDDPGTWRGVHERVRSVTAEAWAAGTGYTMAQATALIDPKSGKICEPKT